MRIVLTIFWVVIVFIILWIFSLNLGQFITIDLVFVQYEQVNILTIALILLLTGIFTGSSFFIFQLFKLKRENRHLKKHQKTLMNELNELKLQLIKQEPQQQSDSETDQENDTNDPIS